MNGVTGTRDPLLLALAGSEAPGRPVAQVAGVEFALADEREFERGEHKARCPVSVRGRNVAVLCRVHGEVEGPIAPDGTLWVTSDDGSDVQRLGTLELPGGRFTPRTGESRWDIEGFDITAAGRFFACTRNEAGRS